jgi:hypothetical protein
VAAPARPRASLPARHALLRERRDALEEILGVEARRAQGEQLALGVRIERALGLQQFAQDALVAGHRQRRVGGQLRGDRQCALFEVVLVDDPVDEPPGLRRQRVDVAPEEEQLARAGRADRVDEAPQPAVRVDQPELGGRHAELDVAAGQAQVAGDRELESAADRRARQHGERRDLQRVERGEPAAVRVRDELLGLRGEVRHVDLRDVIARGEHPVGAGEDHAANALRRGEHVGDRTEDRVVQRVALRRVGNRQPQDSLCGSIDDQGPRHTAENVPPRAVISTTSMAA